MTRTISDQKRLLTCFVLAPIAVLWITSVESVSADAVAGASTYAASCAMCHGSGGADGQSSTKAERTAPQIDAAIADVAAMGSLSLSVTELQDTADYLRGAPVGPPAVGAAVFADKCSSCHGAAGQGPPDAAGGTAAQLTAALARAMMSAISLTPAELDAVVVFLTSQGGGAPPPAEEDGGAQYAMYCAGCHGDFGEPANAAGGNRQVLGSRIESIEGALDGTSVFPGGVPAMAGLKDLSSVQIQAISDYLNSRPVTGMDRYVAACAGCHAMDSRGDRTGESVLGEDAAEILDAIMGGVRCVT